MTGRELDELEWFMDDTDAPTITREQLTFLIAACRERDALIKVVEFYAQDYELDFGESARQALAQHRGEADRGGTDE